ncbi:MAG: hypothetical protein CNLJKLNK_00365 [Holosporales bacterium]
MWIFMKKFTYIATFCSCLIVQDVAANTQSYYSPVIDPKDQSILNFFAPRLGFNKRSDWNNLEDVICEPDACSNDPQIVCYRGKRDPGAVNGRKSCQQQQRERLYEFIGPRVEKLSDNGLPIPGTETPTSSRPSSAATTPASSRPATPASGHGRPSAANRPNGAPASSIPPSVNGSFASNVGMPDREDGIGAGATIAEGVIGAGALAVMADQSGNQSPASTIGSTDNSSLIPLLPQSIPNGQQTLVPGITSPQNSSDTSTSQPNGPSSTSPSTDNTPNTPNISSIASASGTPNSSSTQNSIRPVIPEPKKPSVAVCSTRGAAALRQNIEKAFESNPVTGNDALVRTNEWNVFKVSLVAILTHNGINVKKAKLKALYNSNEIYRHVMKKAYPQSVTNNIRTFTSCYLTLNDPQAFNAYLKAFLQAGKKKN